MYTHHDRLVIPRPEQDMYILLLTECHYNVDNPNWKLNENVLGGVTKYPWEIVGVDFDT